MQILCQIIKVLFIKKLSVRSNQKNVHFRTPIAHCFQRIIKKDSVSLFRTSRFMKQGKILIVDDNEDILFTLKMLLRPLAEKVTTLSDPCAMLPLLSRVRHDVILLDMNFRDDAVSGREGFAWLEEILKLDPQASVVFITAYSDTEKAVRAIKQGATDFIPKPWQNDKLLATVSSALQLCFERRSEKTNPPIKSSSIESTEQTAASANGPARIIGKSAVMQQVLQIVGKCADTEAHLLILGENGTGKDLLARYIHEQSSRRDGPFVALDLGSIPESLFESELFGYEKGAFTDARHNKPGRMEAAVGGTLFLNEVGNLSLPMQAKLLSVLEQRRASRLGATTSYTVNVRLICATNSDLYTAVERREFRQDLLYRMNTIELRLPPLRERGNDLFLLADFFRQRFADQYKKQVEGISREARRQMQQYRWPGNVRELEHVLERAVILSSGPLLTCADLRLPGSSTDPASEMERYHLERVERNHIEEVLRLCGGNITMAAEMLGITRPALYRRMEKYKL